MPLRDDPSGCGKKLHNLRQGRLSPDVRDAALAAVRSVVGNSAELMEVLRQLEASIDVSVSRFHLGEQQAAAAASASALAAGSTSALPPLCGKRKQVALQHAARAQLRVQAQDAPITYAPHMPEASAALLQSHMPASFAQFGAVPGAVPGAVSGTVSGIVPGAHHHQAAPCHGALHASIMRGGGILSVSPGPANHTALVACGSVEPPQQMSVQPPQVSLPAATATAAGVAAATTATIATSGAVAGSVLIAASPVAMPAATLPTTLATSAALLCSASAALSASAAASGAPVPRSAALEPTSAVAHAAAPRYAFFPLLMPVAAATAAEPLVSVSAPVAAASVPIAAAPAPMAADPAANAGSAAAAAIDLPPPEHCAAQLQAAPAAPPPCAGANDSSRASPLLQPLAVTTAASDHGAIP